MWLGSLIGELHRRSVWQVLGSYAVVAWIILQLAETLEGLIGLPLWFGPTIVVVVLLGFPVLLVTTLTQGGLSGPGEGRTPYPDRAEGLDGSFSSWEPLESNPVKNLLRHLFTWRNALLGGFLMAVLLTIGTAGYSGLRSAGIGPLGSLVAKGVFETNEELILSEFEDRTPDGTLGETVTALFRIDLNQSSFLHLLDRGELTQPLIRMQRDPQEPITHQVAVELAQREGVKAVISGEVLPLGPGAVVSTRLVAAGTGEILVALRETARTVDAVPDAVDRLSAQLRERIGESLRSIQGDPPLGEVTTGSIEALRKYVQAEWALDMGDIGTAEALVKEALDEDPDFSMAYRKLGVILSNQERNQDEAKEAFTKAYEGRNRLPDRERLLAEAAYFTYVTDDLDSAILAYEEVLDIYPNDGIAGNNLAVLYGERGEPERAAELYVQSIERGHAPAVSYTNAIFTLYKAGQADSADVILDLFKEAYPSHPQALQYGAALASARFDYTAAEDQALDLLKAQEGNPRWEMMAEVDLAGFAMVRGRLNEGAERLLRAHDLQAGSGTPFTDLPKPVFEALGLASIQLHFFQDAEGAVHTLDKGGTREGAQAGTRVGDEYSAGLEFAGLYAQAGHPQRARELLDGYRSGQPEDSTEGEEGEAALTFAQAAIFLAEGETEEAVRLYREGRVLAPLCDLCGLVEMGEAFEAAAMPDSAVAVWEGYLEVNGLFRSQRDNIGLHRVLLGLGRSYEVLGQPDRAEEYYLWFLDLWSGADPGLRPRVEDIGRRVLALRAGTL